VDKGGRRNYRLENGEIFVVAHFRHDLVNAIEEIQVDSEQSIGITGTIRMIGIIGTKGTIEVEALNRSAMISQLGDTRKSAVFTHHRGNLARPPP